MRILMTNIRLTWYSGSDTYLYTLGKELMRRGHEVSVYAPSISPTLQGKRFIDAGFTLFSELESKFNLLEVNKDFDVIHGQHNMALSEAKRVFPDVPAIFVSHGVLPQPEKYPKDVNIARYIGVSEEVLAFQYKDISEDKKEVIRNPIDTKRFYYAPKKLGKKLKILIASNYYHNEWKAEEVWQAVKILDAEVEVIGTNGKMMFETEKLIKDCDIGIGLGRSILEIMSMGKPVIVGDYNGYDGVVTPGSYQMIKLSNFSSRAYKEVWDGNKLASEIKKIFAGDYEKMGQDNRELILANHNVTKIADRFEKIYSDIIK
jgi:glycosyltransferase involved in cell wall biosynthesis